MSLSQSVYIHVRKAGSECSHKTSKWITGTLVAFRYLTTSPGLLPDMIQATYHLRPRRNTQCEDLNSIQTGNNNGLPQYVLMLRAFAVMVWLMEVLEICGSCHFGKPYLLPEQFLPAETSGAAGLRLVRYNRPIRIRPQGLFWACPPAFL